MSGPLERLYQHRFAPDERAQRRKLWRVLCEHEFSKYVRPSDTVLDLGAGLCDFINQIECARKFAVDLSTEVQTCADANVTALIADAERLGELGLPPIDVVFASNVFEHVRTKEVLGEILSQVHTVLRPGGRLMIMQPNLRYLGGEYWDFLDHQIPLTHVSMTEILAITGFEIEVVKPRFLPYTTKSRIPQHPFLVKLYLKCPPAQWIMGKQMFVVARRVS